MKGTKRGSIWLMALCLAGSLSLAPLASAQRGGRDGGGPSSGGRGGFSGGRPGGGMSRGGPNLGGSFRGGSVGRGPSGGGFRGLPSGSIGQGAGGGRSRSFSGNPGGGRPSAPPATNFNGSQGGFRGGALNGGFRQPSISNSGNSNNSFRRSTPPTTGSPGSGAGVPLRSFSGNLQNRNGSPFGRSGGQPGNPLTTSPPTRSYSERFAGRGDGENRVREPRSLYVPSNSGRPNLGGNRPSLSGGSRTAPWGGRNPNPTQRVPQIIDNVANSNPGRGGDFGRGRSFDGASNRRFGGFAGNQFNANPGRGGEFGQGRGPESHANRRFGGFAGNQFSSGRRLSTAQQTTLLGSRLKSYNQVGNWRGGAGRWNGNNWYAHDWKNNHWNGGNHWRGRRGNWNNSWYCGNWFGRTGNNGFWGGLATGYALGLWNNSGGLYSCGYYPFGYWGYNSLGWGLGLGLGNYWNPYYAGGTYATYTYAEPIVTAYAAEPVIVDEVDAPTPADEAVAEFKARDYGDALVQLDRALQNSPNDAALHEFRALVLFAMGRYDKAAETLYGVLSVGPGWDWPTLRNLYDNVDTYTQQLRRLEVAKKQDPTNPALQFLLGYHYLTCGYPQQALAAFEQVLKVQPEDKVAQEMVKMLSSVGESPNTPTPPPPTTAAAPPSPPQELLPQEQVIGTWSAKGQDDMTYALTLREDNTFSWSFGKEGALQKIEGVYALDKNSLALEPESGGSLLAELAKNPSGGFTFTTEGPSGTQVLDFRRAADQPSAD